LTTTEVPGEADPGVSGVAMEVSWPARPREEDLLTRLRSRQEAGSGGLERSERRPEGVGSLRPVGEILTRMKEVPADP
jgi:hypothetical protein